MDVMEVGVRSRVLGIWDTVQRARAWAIASWVDGRTGRSVGQLSPAWEMRSLLAYAVAYPSRRRRSPMDVEAMVQRWVPIIRSLSTAHSKDEIDRAEFAMEEHLAPLLTAPVAQIREFYSSLVAGLKGDPGIPLFVWAAFEAWHEVVVKKAPDEAVVRLKVDLATEIAAMVEADVRPDIGKAIAGALQWRAPEQLEAVKAAVKGGARPRLVGKESCLFLQVGDATVML